MEFTATVIEISRATEGFGDNQKTIGLKLKLEYHIVDEYTGDQEKRSSTIDVPFSLRSKIGIGDKVTFNLTTMGLLDPTFDPDRLKPEEA
jgi:hypothetical protein